MLIDIIRESEGKFFTTIDLYCEFVSEYDYMISGGKA
jgi:hypothetical protein